MSDFQTETTPTARKRHVCGECYGLISPGDQYRKVVGCWEGDMGTHKQCLACVEARDWAIAQPEWQGDGEFLYYFGRLDEELADFAPEINPGDGRRFHAYRLLVQMNHRRMAALKKKAA